MRGWVTCSTFSGVFLVAILELVGARAARSEAESSVDGWTSFAGPGPGVSEARDPQEVGNAAEGRKPKVANEADDSPVLPFERYALENGLTVILHRDTRLPIVAISVWFDVGGLHERPGRSGFAHLFEHMMFQGSPHVGEDAHFKILQEIGATNINGTTDFDRTNYFETVPSNELELGLWLESDRMGFLLSLLTQKSLDNQRDVVKNERRQSIENRPYGLMEELVTKTLYPPSHPYHGNVIGSMEDLSSATIEDVRDFFRSYYTPANATLTLAGSFEIDDAKALVSKYFGALEGRPRPAPPSTPVPKIAKDALIQFEEPVGRLEKITMVWMAPSIFQPGTAELDLAAHILSGTRSARLDRRVSFDDLIATHVSARLSEYKAGSQFAIEIVVRPDRTLEEAHRAIDEVLADLKIHPPTRAELTRALNTLETHQIASLEILGGFAGRAERLQTYNLFLGDPGRLTWDLERYRKATVDDVSRAIATYLSAPRLIVYGKPMSGALPRGAKS